MITPRAQPGSSTAGDIATPIDVTLESNTVPEDSAGMDPMPHAPEIGEATMPVTATPADMSLPTDLTPADLPPAAEVTEAEVTKDGELGMETQPVASSEVKEDEPPVNGPGLFSRPEIRELLCLHELRIGQGRTLVQVRWAGWGSLRAEAVLEGQVFECRLMYGIPREREIDLLVPVGATLTISVQNLWGADRKVLEVLASEPVLPGLFVPPTPDVINVRMPHPSLPHFPSAAITRLIPSKLRLGIRRRQPLPAIDDRLRHAIAIESRRLSHLPRVLGSAQRYQRHKLSPRYMRQPLSPSYQSLLVSDVNMVPVRDRLKAWMAEIHHGEDEAGSG